MRTRGFLPALVITLLVITVGCHRQPAPSMARTDQQITGDVHSKLDAESALAGQDLQVAVNGGVVTLSGSASDAASRALAGNDAGSVNGVRTVVNNLVVQPPQVAAAPAQSAPQQEPPAAPREHHRAHPTRQPYRPQTPPETAQEVPPPPPPVAAPASAAPAPPPPVPAPPPVPVAKTITLPAGTVLSVRTVEDLNSATAQPDQGFHATLAQDLILDNMIAIPQGTPILGRVVDAKDATHFKGNSLLAVELTRIDLHGRHVAVVTDTVSKQGSGRGRNTAEKAGGGALLGTLIGALAGGGKGAAIGAVAGAGAGTGINAATRGQQVQIPSETLLTFQLQSPITVTTSRVVGSAPGPNDGPEQPSLQPRPQ